MTIQKKIKKPQGEIAGIVPALFPRDTEYKMLGPEPYFDSQKSIIDRGEYNSTMIRCFNWYSHFYSRKDAKEMMVGLLEHNHPVFSDFVNEIKTIKRVPDAVIKSTYGWIARMILRGFVFKQADIENLKSEFSRLIALVTELESKKQETNEVQQVKPTKTREQREHENALLCAGELDGLFDRFLEKPKLVHDFKPVDEFKKQEKPVNLQTVKWQIIPIWIRRLDEFKIVQDGKDRDLNQAYSHFTKAEIKAIVKFCDDVVIGLQTLVDAPVVKQVVVRKPPPVRAVSPEKQAEKFKLLRKFKLSDTVELVSQSAAKLVGGTEAWLYDSDKRKLIWVIASPTDKKYTVQGASLAGIDPEKTLMKTIRKPETELVEFLKLGKPAMRKWFEDHRSVASAWTGRSNPNLLILKV